MNVRFSALLRCKYSLFFTLLSFSAQATPTSIRVQGALYSSSGVPQSSSRDIQLKVYDAASAGTLLWTSSVTQVDLSAGRFEYLLDASSGSPSLLSQISQASALWFEIHIDTGTAGNATMDSDSTVSPRIQSKGTLFAASSASTDAIQNYSVSTAVPSDGQVLTWNNSNSQWEPALAPGTDATLSTTASRSTTAATTLYVRTDGSDSICNGTVDASSASTPACALATPQAALDLLPEYLLDAATVQIASGTYRAASSGAVLLSISKATTQTGSLYVLGNGGPIFSGATSGAPSTPVGSIGIQVLSPTQNLTLSGFQVEYFKDAGVQLTTGTAATLSGITSSNNDSSNGAKGLETTQSTLTLKGNHNYSSNAYGLYSVQSYISGGTSQITANSNSSAGIYIGEASSFLSTTGATLTANSNTSQGVYVANQSLASLNAVTATSTSAGDGFYVNANSTVIFSTGTSSLSGNSSSGLRCEGISFCNFQAGADAVISSNTQSNIEGKYGANILLNGSANTFTINGSVSGSGSIVLSGMSRLELVGITANIARGSLGAGTGIALETKSTALASGGSISITQFQTYGINTTNQSSFIDLGATATRTISNASTSVNVSEQSLYRKGSFSASGTCDASSRCN